VLSALAPTSFTWPTAPYSQTIDKAGEACQLSVTIWNVWL